MSNIYANNINPRSGTTVTFPQNIKVLGTATYEDVANVDSVGVVTAQSGIHVTGGSVGIGTAVPEEIVHILASPETIDSRDGVTLQHSTATSAANNGLPLVWSGYVGSGAGLQNYGLASICGRKENSNADDGAAYLQFGTGSVAGAITERLRINSVGELISSNGTLRRNVSDSSFTISGDSASNTGANINLYGASHSGLANIFRVRVGASEKLRIAAGGNVGIGEDDPETLLHLKAATTPILTIQNTTNTSYSGIQFDRAADDTQFAIYSYDSSHASEADNVQFYNYQSGDLIFVTNSLERLRINSVGQTKSSGPIQIQNGAIFASHSRAYTASTTATGLFGLQMTGGHGFADLTWAFVDTGYPNGVRMGKIFLTFRGSGTNITAVTIASSTESSITNGTLASITWTASVGNVSNVRLNGTASSASGNGTLYLYGTSPSFTGLNPIANA